MCLAPCCGTVKDIQTIIDAGYADRLMLDSEPGPLNQPDMLKPALKGYEGEKSPYATWSPDGCTFFNDGKCDLHQKGLKPTLGKLANHSVTSNLKMTAETKKAEDIVEEDWQSEEAIQLIEKWTKRKI